MKINWKLTLRTIELFMVIMGFCVVVMFFSFGMFLQASSLLLANIVVLRAMKRR